MTGERDGNGGHSQNPVKNVEWHSGRKHPKAPATHEQRMKVPIGQGQGGECNRGEPEVPPQ
jgi:hypothetical protein